VSPTNLSTPYQGEGIHADNAVVCWDLNPAHHIQNGMPTATLQTFGLEWPLQLPDLRFALET